MIIRSVCDGLEEEVESLLPVRIVSFGEIEGVERLMNQKAGAVLYRRPDLASVWKGKGSFVLLDFGKEIHGGARVIVCKAKEMVHFRLTFGESVAEAMSQIGEKNAGNDHSPRDFTVLAGKMSDNLFGQTGFRFLRVELLDDVEVKVQDILAQTVTAHFEREGTIETDDPVLNEIVKVSARTLKLCFQKGYLWDGIKRDRLIWCGDLHPEIVTGLYWFGDVPHFTNSLSLFCDYTPSDEWINNIPSYSAWWIINFCEYCSFTGNRDYWEEKKEYGKAILRLMRSTTRPDGTVFFEGERNLNYFLDWSTQGNPESRVGVASLFVIAAKKWLEQEENEDARAILANLSSCISAHSETKPVRAFQILAGRENPSDAAFLEKGGAEGFSTFMAFYILTATAMAGGSEMLETLKKYYGGMLSRGATTFWEDFDLSWLENSGRVDEIPKEGELDIHGDFGKHCYEGFRHSLCHGWSAGILSFLIQHVLGIRVTDGGKRVLWDPHPCGLSYVKARLPLGDGWLDLHYENGAWTIDLPQGIQWERT